MCRFLRLEVCHVSDHLARMSKYDSEEWTAALCHFDGWTESSPDVNEAVCRIVSGQKLIGVRESADDACSSLLRSQIGDTVLKAMQSAKDEAGRDAYAYKDAPTPPPAGGRGGRSGSRAVDETRNGSRVDESRVGRRPPNNCNVSARVESGARPEMFSVPARHLTLYASSPSRQSSHDTRNTNRTWTSEGQLRHAMRKRTINDASWDNGGSSGYHGHHPQYAHDVSYRHQHHPAASFDGYAAGQYYPPHHHGGHHPPPPPPPVHAYGGVDYGHNPYPPPAPPGFHPGDMSYDPQQQYYGGYYHHGHLTPDGSFHEGMVFDHSYHSHQDVSATTYAQTPGRPWHPHHQSAHHPPHAAGSPYWGHLNLSQLPGVAASPVVHQTPSRPPRDGRPRNAGGRHRGGGHHNGQGGAGRGGTPPASPPGGAPGP